MPEANKPAEEELQSVFTAACAHHQAGNLIKAKQGYLQVLEIADHPLLRYNLGLIHYDEGNFELARDSFEAADRLRGDDIDTIFNLALSYKQTGHPRKSVELYKRLLAIEPHHIDAKYNLAGCFRELREYEEAVKVYREVLALHPAHEAAVNNVAYSCQVLGRKEDALNYYHLLLELNPRHEGAKHMIDALQGHHVDHSPEGYVRDVFDNYSTSYEESLVNKLKYNVPSKIRVLLDSLPRNADLFATGIDLGCGTGLSGEAFADRVKFFIGVDLSPKMIEAAGKKGIYANLTVGNLQDALQDSPAPFDFVLAADVFAYIGKLDDLFGTIGDCCSHRAVICFSTETDDENDYILRSTGRFAHAPRYIRSLTRKNGLTEKCHQKTQLRKEAGDWVEGDLWIFQKDR